MPAAVPVPGNPLRQIRGTSRLCQKGEPWQPGHAARLFITCKKRPEQILRIQRNTRPAGQLHSICRQQVRPVHLPGKPCQTDQPTQQHEPPQHPCRSIPAGRRNTPPCPEQKRQQADQRHGAELLLADVLGLHYGFKQLCQKPCSCGKQPDPLHGCPLPAGREHPTDACEQKSLNRSMNDHPTRRDTGLHFFCQRSCPHAQCQHGSRKAFLFLYHFPSRFCQILKSCAERRR